MRIIATTDNGYLLSAEKYELQAIAGQTCLSIGAAVNVRSALDTLARIKTNKDIPSVANRLRCLADLIEAEGPFIEGLSETAKESENV
jgi:hypothetical protein